MCPPGVTHILFQPGKAFLRRIVPAAARRWCVVGTGEVRTPPGVFSRAGKFSLFV